jgi:diadenosine tetraphosphatase ApaH/serine/threonine PP2A family protein phosphatase
MDFSEKVCDMVHFIHEAAQEAPDPAVRVPEIFACDVVTAGGVVFMEEPAVLDLRGDYVIVGDIHGDLKSLLRIFDHHGWPPARNYLFLGDYVDRGMCSCEVILLLYALKYLYPDKVSLIRGNHEFGPMTEVYGFQDEALSKVSELFYLTVVRTFDDLPLAAVLNEDVLCVHGGISPGLSSLSDLRKVRKLRQWGFSLNDSANDLLWSDPSDEVADFAPSSRGCGFRFGASATEAFMQNSGLKFIIRAHEVCPDGFHWHFDQSVLTLFSACNYCENDNKAAAAIYSRESGLEFSVFEPLDKPNRRFVPRALTWKEADEEDQYDGYYESDDDLGEAP